MRHENPRPPICTPVEIVVDDDTAAGRKLGSLGRRNINSVTAPIGVGTPRRFTTWPALARMRAFFALDYRSDNYADRLRSSYRLSFPILWDIARCLGCYLEPVVHNTLSALDIQLLDRRALLST